MNTKQITAANADELMEQREQRQTCLDYAESRQKKTEGQMIKQRVFQRMLTIWQIPLEYTQMVILRHISMPTK